MIKSVLKVVYVAFGLIVAVLVYIVGYNSNGFNHISNLTAKAIEAKDYVEVAKIHGGCFDTTNLVEENEDILDLAIFPSTTLTTISYYTNVDEKTTTTVNSYDNSYYIYIFNPQLDMDTKEFNGKTMNYTGIRFSSSNGYYDYKFQITEELNSEDYIEYPQSVKEYLLNSERNLFNSYANWNFFNLTLTSTLINAMESELNGDITSISVLDRDGTSKFTYEVNLDFSQQFFTDVALLVKNYNVYIEEVNSDDETIQKGAEDKFNEFYLGTETTKGFLDIFNEIEQYSFRHEDSYLQPASLVWQTIGILVLYLICAFLLYMLFFHFAFLKGLISRDSRKNNYRAKPTTKKKEAIDAKVTVSKENTKTEEVTDDK